MSHLKLRKTIGMYLFLTGFLGHLLVLIVFLYLMNVEQLSARLLIKKAISTVNVSVPEALESALQPQAKYANLTMNGSVLENHPRIIFPQLSGWNGQGISPFIRQRIIEHKNNRSYLNSCRSDGFMFEVVCWLSTNDEKLLKKIVRKMLGYELNIPTADTTYSNGWQLALAYDLMFPALNDGQRKLIENKIVKALKASLLNLDENSASLWHGRSTHASIAWICAVVLSQSTGNVEQLQSKAQGHFLNAIDGLAYTEVWPGGYNYWIQNRALIFALASSAYINGLTGAENVDKIKRVMRRVGYWTLYATRPDNKIEGFGDEGSRIDLKDETRRAIDLIVQVTRDPTLAGYSKYLGKLHGRESYYRGYRWGWLLFNDPSVWGTGDGTIESLGKYLPVARLFGENATNYAYFRSGWGRDDTFVSFKAGHTFAHHGHYDAGHFTIFKGAPLAINSSTYNGFFTPHRLNYAIRTIAKNSLLIQKPHEKVQPNRHFKTNVADGGQRITMPTGSAVLSLADWFENYQQGRHYEGAELLNFGTKANDYAYISADLAPAYNKLEYDENSDGGKIIKAVRQLLYLPKEDHIIIYDNVRATQSSYQKKWLLHTVNKPKVNGLTILKGDSNNGILESKSNQAVVSNGRGFLRVKAVYPENLVMRLVGGKDYQYYVETDGDDTVLDGINFAEGSSDKSWHDVGMWRIEIQPETKAESDRFLIVMSPSLDYRRYDQVKKLDLDNKDIVGITTENSVIIFAPSVGSYKVNLTLTERKKQIMVIGLSVFKKVTIQQDGHNISQELVNNGVVYYDSVLPLQGKISVKW